MSSVNSRSLSYSLALQFAIIVVPIALVFFYQAARDFANADAVKFETQSVALAQQAYDSYKVFLDGAADAADTGYLSARGYEALERAERSVRQLQTLDRTAEVRGLLERLNTLLNVARSDRSLGALLSVRTAANQADRLLGALVEFHRQRSRQHIERIAEDTTGQVWMACLALVLAIVCISLIVRRLSAPLYRAVSLASAIAAGHLKDAGAVDPRRDIGGLLGSLDAMRSKLKRAFDELAEKEKRLSHAQQIGRIGDWMIDVASGEVTRSDEVYAILDIDEDEAPAGRVVPTGMVHPDDRELVEESFLAASRAGKNFKIDFRIVLRNGVVHFLAAESEVARDATGKPTRVVGVLQDITQRKTAEIHIERLALHDSLTGLANRTFFSRLLNHGLKQAQRHKEGLAVLFIDLDRFKYINDTLGHDTGDALLKEFAQRLREGLRKTDTIGRLGGDEFVVLAEGVNSQQRMSALAHNILAIINRPFFALGKEFHVTASIGIALYPQDGRDEQSLMKNADIAMYRAKEAGRNNFQFYSHELNAHLQERFAMEADLRRALERNEFVLHYQPKLSLRTGHVTGAEALLRWQHPANGLVPPAKFVPLAEDTGLIVPIGKWVLRAACEQALAWRQQGLPRLGVSVNLSARQFADPDLLRDIVGVVEATGVDPDLLELEITESMLMQNIEKAIATLTALADRGIRLAIDDFGTGYSSLYALKRFPLTTLKIDRSFIRDVPGKRDDMAITDAIVAMGRSLRMTVIAEGVERKDQVEYLDGQGCDEIQGYYVSKPLPAQELAAFLRRAPRGPTALQGGRPYMLG
jgi:diguanylate cyclase (GGDEF)-like protein/PAS domain S-box-containing protein